VELLEGNTGEVFHDPGLGKKFFSFLDRTPKTQATRAKIEK
jgi:hypothetical protein